MWSSLLASASSTTQIGIDLPSNFGAGEESDEDHSKFSDFIKSRDIPIAVASSPQETAVEGGEEGKKGKKRLSKRERKDEKKKTKKKKIAAVASIVESVKEEEEEEKEKEEVVVDDVKEKKKKKKEKKEKKEKKSKKEKKETTSNPTTPPLPTFPYPTDSSDHCETPLIAYTHISPLLSHLSKTSPNLKIYDPYYCDGSVVNKLGNLGYYNVHNLKEDCYDIWSNNREPEHDLILTNPPYSEDHVEKLITWLVGNKMKGKPWMLLLPVFFHKHGYYKELTKHIKPFYLVPKKRYVYLPPENFRSKTKSDTHKKSSPFTSMWYIWGGDSNRNEELIKVWNRLGTEGVEIARSRSGLRDLRRKGK